jgi:indole-3-glycerol phosphate synthase
MSGFLDDMARASSARALAAQQQESFAALERRATHAPAAAPLRLSSAGFDVIAELKLRSPAAGRLGDETDDWLERVAAYARGGAAAVSVLTEPSRFDGSLEHLRQAAAALAPHGIPAMRKDFLVDPYQILEARAAGAGGVLVIVRMLTLERIAEMLELAAAHRMFVLLEAFDTADLDVARQALAARVRPGTVLIGINSRDLQTLAVVQRRFADLAPFLPQDAPCVAESGVATPSDARGMQRLGYRVALIGTALMSCEEPEALLQEILNAARTAPP